MKRAFIMVLDSFGIGATEDAERLVTWVPIPWVTSRKPAKGEADNGRKKAL